MSGGPPTADGRWIGVGGSIDPDPGRAAREAMSAALSGEDLKRVSKVRIAGEAMAATVGFSSYPSDGGSANLLLARADSRMLADKSRARMPRPGGTIADDAADQPAPSDGPSDLVGAELP